MKIPKYADSSDFSGFSMRIDETWQRKNQAAEKIDMDNERVNRVDEVQTKKLQEIRIGTTDQSELEPELQPEHLVDKEQQLDGDTNKVLSEEEIEYLELLREKDTILENKPDATNRTKEEKAHLRRIYHRMEKISKRTNVEHLYRPKKTEKEKQEQARRMHAEWKRNLRENMSVEEKEEERQKEKMRKRKMRK